jgi:putative ABC transport system permease protein
VRYGSDEMKVNLIGVTPDYPYAQNLILKNGRFPDEQDLKTYKRVCAIGYGVKKELFPLTDPLGKDLKISNLWFKIVGVMEQKEVSAKKIGEYQIRNFNQDLMVPISCSEKLFYRPALISPLNEIIVKVKSGTEVQAAGNILQRLISRRHHQQDDFKVVIPEDLLRQSQATQRIFNIVMGAIASISLLVGGIGIMNIMLSSVLERTREIGICRAIGAKKAEIMGQYLTESVTLSFAGGIMGILLGMILAKVITFYAGWVTIISFFSVISAFAVATGVGLVFGLYPARRAANLNPIDALRFE